MVIVVEMMRVLMPPRMQKHVSLELQLELELELEPSLDRLATCESSCSFREPCGRSLRMQPWPRRRLRRRFFFVNLETCCRSFYFACSYIV